MTVKEVLTLVLKNLSREDILSTSAFNTSSQTELNEEQKDTIENLINCLNDTIFSIAYIYLPFKTTEKIKVTNETFDYNQLDKILIDIIKIKDENGVNIKFTTFPTFFRCKNGNHTITYTYSPQQVSTLSDTLPIEEGKISTRTLAVGTTSKFYLRRGMYQDANAWDLSFQRLMLIAQRPKHMPKISSRGWF